MAQDSSGPISGQETSIARSEARATFARPAHPPDGFGDTAVVRRVGVDRLECAEKYLCGRRKEEKKEDDDDDDDDDDETSDFTRERERVKWTKTEGRTEGNGTAHSLTRSPPFFAETEKNGEGEREGDESTANRARKGSQEQSRSKEQDVAWRCSFSPSLVTRTLQRPFAFVRSFVRSFVRAKWQLATEKQKRLQ